MNNQHTHQLTKSTDSEILQYALNYFDCYIKFDTIADAKNPISPSNPAMWDLAEQIKSDLEELGLATRLDEHCYLYATLPANLPAGQKAKYRLGLIAHMDTSPDMSGKDINARRVTYTGEDIVLNQYHPSFAAQKEAAITLSQTVFPNLKHYLNQDIIVTDGHTLLGADDKAGLVEIMALVKYLINHPEIPHGDIQVAFTPDEEIGRGADYFDVVGFGADYAFTMDGSALGEIEWESFNAASARITIKGLSVHTGTAKGKMRNAQTLAARFVLAMPQSETPENTEGYEGFYHLTELQGMVEKASLEYIIRDFDKAEFQRRKDFMQDLVDKFNQEFDGEEVFSIEIKDTYYNMKEKIKEHEFIVDYAKEAMHEVGIEPLDLPIRGGTDGSRLSYMGLPCPNLFTGGENFHGKYEYLSVDTMQKALEVLIQLVQKFI